MVGFEPLGGNGFRESICTPVAGRVRSRPVLNDLKVWIGRLYKEGDPDIRIYIVQATLEHLFEQEQLREFFSDWKDDKILAVAHEEASEWYKGGGRSPLGKPHRSDW